MTAGAEDDRHRVVAALARARRQAYRPEAYAGQESFVSEHEVVALARAASIARGSRVLDLCSGVGGPGRRIVRATGCRLVAADRCLAALVLARGGARGGARQGAGDGAAGGAGEGARAGAGIRAGFVAAEVPALPFVEPFEVVLLVETVLAFPDKAELVSAVARLLVPGGRFAFTVEEGAALSPAERRAMPGGDTVWPIELADLRRLLEGPGLEVRSLADHTAAHAVRARRLARAFSADREAIGAALGEPVLQGLRASHELWARWLATRRVRKLALVCRRLS